MCFLKNKKKYNVGNKNMILRRYKERLTAIVGLKAELHYVVSLQQEGHWWLPRVWKTHGRDGFTENVLYVCIVEMKFLTTSFSCFLLLFQNALSWEF